MQIKHTLIRPLTPKQKAIVNYVSTHINQKGYSPSLGEIAKQFNLKAVSTVHQHIQLIQQKGYLRRDSFQSRGLSQLTVTRDYVEIPLLGNIAAGNPIEPLEDPEPIAVPKSMLSKPSNYYALRVRGDSMIDDGVWDGDIVLIEHKNFAEIGEMVVAVVDGEVTLKRYGGVKNSKVVLIPKNPSLQPFNVNPNKFEIRGIFSGLIRSNIQ